MQSQRTDLQRNSALPEIYLIICEIFRLKMDDFELRDIFK